MVTLTQDEFAALSPEKQTAHLAAEEMTVFGRTVTGEPDFQRDKTGKPIEHGIGSPGHETGNHLAAIRKYEGEEAYQAAVAKIWKENPDRAAALNLPKSKGR
jgi:hypothetical protein